MLFRSLIRPSIKDNFGWAIAVVVFVIMSFTDVSAVYVLLASAAAGITISYIKGYMKMRKGA